MVELNQNGIPGCTRTRHDPTHSHLKSHKTNIITNQQVLASSHSLTNILKPPKHKIKKQSAKSVPCF